MNPLIIRNASEIVVEVTPDALELRGKLVNDSQLVLQCESDMEQEIVVEIIRSLKQFAKDAETARVDIKKPVLDAQRAIDGIAKKLLAPVEVEAARLQILANRWEAKKQAAAAAERERIRKEQEEIERKAREEREAAEKAAREAKTLEEKANAEAALQQAKIAPPAPAVPAVMPNKVEGTASKEVWKFEVEDLKALYAARPDLVYMEAIPAAIRREIAVGLRHIPGLKIWSERELNVRTEF